jgi:NAD(P)-dependent dehydrogenase (short-subunit alcohol dehydrogenase family)
MEPRAIRDRVAFVTGAGGGMGYRIAADLAKAGAQVFAVDVKEPPQPDPEGSDRSGLHFLQFDITAAGVCWFDVDGPVGETDPAVWQRVLDINLTAAMQVCRHAIPLMRQTGGGAFVHVASVAGLRTSDGTSDAYQVSKAGLMSLSRAIAFEYGPERIRSNTICPGAILTPMIQPLYDEDPARAVRMANRTPLRRLGTPEDVSSACQFLLSDDASFITGTDIVVDGGWTLALA